MKLYRIEESKIMNIEYEDLEKRLPSNNKKESKENQRKKSIENQNIPPPIIKPSKEIQQMYSILEEKLQDYSFNYLNISNNKVNLRKRGIVKKKLDDKNDFITPQQFEEENFDIEKEINRVIEKMKNINEKNIKTQRSI